MAEAERKKTKWSHRFQAFLFAMFPVLVFVLLFWVIYAILGYQNEQLFQTGLELTKLEITVNATMNALFIFYFLGPALIIGEIVVAMKRKDVIFGKGG